MSNLEIKDAKGKKVGSHTVSKTITEFKPVDAVIHRTVVAEMSNKRQGTQSAKTRSETRGGGKKPYKQKKTGNARQGTTRAPHYAHGGMALAVKPRSYEKHVNRKERRAAIVGALSIQIDAGNVQIADAIVFANAKTKTAVDFLKAFGVADAKRILIVLPAYDETTYKCFRNLPNVVVKTAPSSEEGAKTDVFSTRDLMVAGRILVAKEAMAKIEEVWAK